MSIEPCPLTPTPPERGVVVFSPTAFKTAFPEFATVADAALTMNFMFATLVLNNSCCSVIADAAKRELLLNLLTAHITQLRNGINGQAAGLIVGRISDATEGSDSVSTDMGDVPFNAAYFMQTQWGVMFWQAVQPYIMARYVPPPAVCADFPGGGVFPVGPNYPGGGCGC